ncbi:MAG TPA: GDSL-type esterase/lipase family protein [Puia sp.]|nr:GDSL-type esterase/lipase family protein [Puia sp.]
MRNLLIALAACLALPASGISQQKITIVALGSSTTFGLGASTFDSSWVGRTRIFFGKRGLKVVDTIYDLGQSGASTYAGMPDGFIPPGDSLDRSAHGFNITAAMALQPDIVIINYPSNDVNYGIPMATFLSDLRTMSNIVTSAGKICLVSTTQPRSFPNHVLKELLKEGRDSVLMEFGGSSLNFYDQLVKPDGSLELNPVLMSPGSPDTVHPDDAGHALLAQVVKNTLLGIIPLPLLLTDFSGTITYGSAVVQWTTVNEQGKTSFDIQKSTDGQSFSTVHRENGKGGQANTYSWMDPDLLPGTSFYRLRITEDGNQSFSKVVSVGNTAKTSLISKIYRQNANMLSVDLLLTQDGPVNIAVVDVHGQVVRKQSITASSLFVTIPIPVAGLPEGIYFLKVNGAAGQHETKAFSKF